MNIELYETMGWRGAIRAMRMPRRSWDKSDSRFSVNCEVMYPPDNGAVFDTTWTNEIPILSLGQNDIKLACKLIKAGGHHRVFMRHIFVQMEANATHKFWSHFDKYDHAECSSTSTSWDIKHGVEFEYDKNINPNLPTMLYDAIGKYLDDPQALSLERAENAVPKGALQLRFVSTNYECLYTMYQQRKRHHNVEWKEFCGWIETLPYMKEFLTT